MRTTPAPRDLSETLYLIFTQKEKKNLIHQGYRVNIGSKMLTIYEVQSLTNATVIVLNTNSMKLQLHDSVSHAIVSVTRHTNRYSDYSSGEDDAIKRLIRKATEAATTKEGIVE